MMKNNKKRAILLLVACLALISSFAYSLDAPHSPANMQDCASCHDFYSTNPYLMTNWTGGYTMQDDDDTPLNHLCRSCHNPAGSAPAHDTHSYLGVGYATSATSPYGGWQVRCSTCHNPHYQDQAKAYLKTTDTYWKVKLTVDTVTTSATSSTIKATGIPGWVTDAYVNMHVIPDVTAKYPVSYQIIGNNSDTLTVKGPLNPATGLSGKTFAIFIGKLVRNQIKLDDIANPQVTKTGRKTVRFFNASGTKSFADGDTTYDGICEVCHTQTTHFKNDGTGADQIHTNQGAGIPGKNCTTACHAANDGFQPSGCNTCHGYPVDAGSLISLDASGASATSDSNGPGAHVAHNVKFSCTNCHTGGMLGGAPQGDNLINIGFYYNGNLGGNYDGTASRTVFNYAGAASTTVTTTGSLQCSSLYCHSSGQSTNGASAIPSSYATPAWNGAAACGTCHAVTEGSGLTSGSHAAHLGTAGVNGCADCHTGAANNASTYNSANHVNRSIDVANTYSAAGAPGNGYGTCSAASCHDNGTGSPAVTPTWGSSAAACAACHAVVPSTGSHQKHVNTTLYSMAVCGDCHDGAVRATTSPSTHLDGDLDVFDVASGDLGYPNNVAKGGAPYDSCSTAYCHSTGQSTTSGTSATPTYASVAWGGAAACGTCHAVAEGSGLTSGSHGAHLGTAGVNGCADCHTGAANNASSYDSTNHVNKLIDIASATTYTAAGVLGNGYGTCSTANCHDNGTGSPAVTPTWGSTAAACTACHAAAPVTGSHSAHLSASVKVNGSNIVCANCHNDAVQGTTAPTGDHRDNNVDVYDASSGDLGYTANKTKNTAYTTCTTASCHTNGQDDLGTTITQKTTPIWGTIATCTTCHDFNGSMQPSTANHTTHITRTGGTCVQCHDVYGDNTTEPDLNSPLHINNIINVAQGGVVSFGYDGNGSGNHAPGAGYGTCSTVSCHGGGATRTWGQLGDACADCHSNLGGPTGGDRGHAFHVQTAYVGAITASSYGDYTGNNWYSYSNTGGNPDMGCGYCHPQSDATHNNGVVNLNFNPADTGAAGTLKAKNAASETYAHVERTSATCSSVYCHSDGYANPGYGYKTSPEWYAGNFVGNKCDDCHGNSPASDSHGKHVVGIHYEGIYTGSTDLAVAGASATSSHGNSLYSTTITCNVCHNNTVTQTANASNSTCNLCHSDTNSPATGNEVAVIYASSTTHVNGTPDIAFSVLNVKSKAQVRDNITSVADLNASWNRTASGVAYKASGAYDQANNALNTPTMFDNVSNTCSTVACHNGNSVRWGDTGITCNNCHTDLTK